jgi:hypothetical protein
MKNQPVKKVSYIQNLKQFFRNKFSYEKFKLNFFDNKNEEIIKPKN